jgi:hypothetical protein
VLTELVGRPADSPAVRRARGGASAAEPVASLLAELLPDGSWATPVSAWRRYAGTAWRWVAASAWGADPSDPRMLASAELLLETAEGDGGVAVARGLRPSPIATGRLVHAAAAQGLVRQLRVQEALAWFEDEPSAWACSACDRFAAAVALMGGLATAGDLRRSRLVTRLVTEILGSEVMASTAGRVYAHPNLARADAAEALWALARGGVPFESRMAAPLERLQAAQLEGGRWPVRRPVPASLPVDDGSRTAAGAPSRWITLRAVVALNAYAVPAGLPRLFPQKPQ